MDKIYMTVCAGHDRAGGLAAECFSHAGLEAILWRHLLAAGSRSTAGPVSCKCCSKSPTLAEPTRRKSSLASAEACITSWLRQITTREATNQHLTLARRILRRRRRRSSKQGYDPVHGGFGRAPKFPSTQPSCVPAALRPAL